MNVKTESQLMNQMDPLGANPFGNISPSDGCYQAFLLRLWRVGNDDQEQPTWRLMLEEVHSHQRYYFATLIELDKFLRNIIRK